MFRNFIYISLLAIGLSAPVEIERATQIAENFYNARYDGDTKGFPAMQYYWESIVAECILTPQGAKKINLFPIELGYKLPRPQRGRPVVAREENKQRIINKLAELSSDFGTEIQYSERGVGEVILK